MGKPYTDSQRKALHLYCELLAQSLNNAGLDMKKTLKEEIEIPWTKDLVKEHIWRPVQVAMTGIDSTTKLETVNCSEIYEVLNRHTAQKLGVSVAWPSIEELKNRSLAKEN